MPIAAAAVVAAGLGARWPCGAARPAPPAADIWRVTRVTNDTGVTLNPAISRDGRLVTYVSDRGGNNTDLWVQQVDGGDPVQLTRDLAFCHDPAFSPDGSKIAVTCGVDRGTVYVVPTLGGLPRRIAEGEWPQFSPDGSQISYVPTLRSGAAPETIWIAPANGGAGREVKPGKPFRSPPVWHPDGKSLFIINVESTNGPGAFDWYLVSADNGAATATGAGDRLRAVDFGPGRNLSVTEGGILFPYGTLDSTNIYRMPFDAGFTAGDRQSRAGHRRSRIQSLSNVIVGRPAHRLRGGHEPEHEHLAGGRRSENRGGLWCAVARDGRTGDQPDALAIARRQSGWPIEAARNAHRRLRLRDFAANTDRAAGGGGGFHLSRAFARRFDGGVQRRSSRSRARSTWCRPRVACRRRFVTSAAGPWTGCLTARSSSIDNAGPKQRDIHIVDVATGQARPLLQHPEFQLTMPRLSPDGRVLTFTEVRPGRARRINLVPFTGEAVPESQWSVVLDGADLDRQPVWSPSGDIIYFLSDRDGTRCIWAQRVDTSTRKAVGQPFAAHHIHQVRYYLNDVGDPAAVGLTVVNGQMYFAGFEIRSNVWMAERREGAP